jgi:hypothetical protein
MKGKDIGGIEETLKRLVPRAVPAGLGDRVVGRALGSRGNALVTPRLRTVAAVSVALALTALVGDAVVSRRQSGRLAALLHGPVVPQPAGDEAATLWAELGPVLGDLDRFRREEIVLSRRGSRGGAERAYLEAREKLKGMIDHENAEDLN